MRKLLPHHMKAKFKAQIAFRNKMAPPPYDRESRQDHERRMRYIERGNR